MDKLLEIILGNPESAGVLIKTYIDKYKPLAYVAGKEVLGVMEDFANCKEYFNTIAVAKKNQFDSYVSVGFTEEQAMALILNDNLQLIKNMKELNNSASKSKK